MASKPKVVLITGCSTGIGLTAAVALAKDVAKRFKVYATVENLDGSFLLKRRAGDLTDDFLFIKQLDLSSEEQIKSVVDEIILLEENIDILVNSAEMDMFGALETQELEKIKSLFSKNVFGPINLCKKVIEVWKGRQFGHIIMISSVSGLIGTPFRSIYSASKFALEGFSEAVAAEFKSSGLKVSIIEPGPVVNNAINDSQATCKVEKIDNQTKDMLKIFVDKESSRLATMGQKPEEIANYILLAIDNPDPQFRYETNNIYSLAIEKKLNNYTERSSLGLG